MYFFQDISDFSKVSDYLAIINASIIVEVAVVWLTFNSAFAKWKTLELWYKKFQLSAVMADVIIVCIGLIVTRLLYKYIFGKRFSIIYFTLLALLLQIIHDFLFYFIFSLIPRGHNAMIDVFKDYAKESGVFAVIGDSGIILFSCLIASILAKYSLNTNIIILFIALYFIPYVLQG
jgi:uncharacterized protein YacL